LKYIKESLKKAFKSQGETTMYDFEYPTTNKVTPDDQKKIEKLTNELIDTSMQKLDVMIMNEMLKEDK
jgi:hypothetical protein